MRLFLSVIKIECVLRPCVDAEEKNANTLFSGSLFTGLCLLDGKSYYSLNISCAFELLSNNSPIKVKMITWPSKKKITFT